MKYYFAPMEGITGHIYRGIHRRMFGGADKYFTPFIMPNQNHSLTTRERRDILPENNVIADTVPQLMTSNAEHFIWAAGLLRDMGYREVNLNLGCPSRTVVSKGRGAGFLAHPDEIDRFLDSIFSAADMNISIKTRIGCESAELLPRLIAIFNKYPISEITVHPRLQADYYRGAPDMDAFAYFLEASANPIVYNGDLFTREDAARFSERFHAVRRLMLGRGAVADPSLPRALHGGRPLELAELMAFHDALLDGYMAELRDPVTALFRMKELWTYMGALFKDSQPCLKRIRKAAKLEVYRESVRIMANECALAPLEHGGNTFGRPVTG